MIPHLNSLILNKTKKNSQMPLLLRTPIPSLLHREASRIKICVNSLKLGSSEKRLRVKANSTIASSYSL